MDSNKRKLTRSAAANSDRRSDCSNCNNKNHHRQHCKLIATWYFQRWQLVLRFQHPRQSQTVTSGWQRQQVHKTGVRSFSAVMRRHKSNVQCWSQIKRRHKFSTERTQKQQEHGPLAHIQNSGVKIMLVPLNFLTVISQTLHIRVCVCVCACVCVHVCVCVSWGRGWWLGEMELWVGSNIMIHFLYILLFLIWHMYLYIIQC